MLSRAYELAALSILVRKLLSRTFSAGRGEEGGPLWHDGVREVCHSLRLREDVSDCGHLLLRLQLVGGGVGSAVHHIGEGVSCSRLHVPVRVSVDSAGKLTHCVRNDGRLVDDRGIHLRRGSDHLSQSSLCCNERESHQTEERSARGVRQGHEGKSHLCRSRKGS